MLKKNVIYLKDQSVVLHSLLLMMISILWAISEPTYARSDALDIVSISYIGLNVNTDKPSELASNKNVQPLPPSANTEVIYTYDGSKGVAYLGAKAVSEKGDEGSYYELSIKPGFQKNQRVIITRPETTAKVVTTAIEVFIYIKDPATGANRKLVTRRFDVVINWPEKRVWAQPVIQSKASQNDKLLWDAIDMVDASYRLGNGQLDLAKRNLDTVILNDPGNAQAYLELARIAMKADDTGTENSRYTGLDEAHRLIKVALRVNPSYANSYILLGYVLAVQKNTDEAIMAFKKAQQIGTRNMWLYYNWGLALENAHRTDEAIKKYREGIALTPMPNTPELRSDNRAIPGIFTRLMELLRERKDFAAMDVLHQKRLTVLNGSCEKTMYASFKLYEMGDYEAAIKYATEAQEQNCHSGARPLLGIAYLTKWALDPSKMDAKERINLLNRAQAFISDTQQSIVYLASSSYTSKVLPKLKEAGIQLDGLDAKGMTPLGYAATQGEDSAIKALIAAGANPDIVFQEGWTPLMLAVASDQTAAVAVLVNAKVNTERKNKQGQNALSIARSNGNAEIIKLLKNKTQF